MAETLLPTAMVPGLVTVKDKEGRLQNVWPIDAKELINSGDFELVENGAIEAARMTANPLRSDRARGLQAGAVAAEVTGIAGAVVVAEDEKAAEKIQKDSAGAEGAPADPDKPSSPQQQDRENAQRSANLPPTDAEKQATASTSTNKSGSDNKSGDSKSSSDNKSGSDKK